MKKYLELLQTCPLFFEISAEQMEAMLGCLGARVASYPKKTAILSEGEPARELGIVLSGAAQIVRNDFFGNRSIVAEVGPAELFGETFACAGVEQLPVDVVAREESQIMLIDCRKITQSCCNACIFHQQMIFNLMRVMARKNLIFHQKIEVTSQRSTREKLMAYLLAQAKKSQSSEFCIPYDRQELADYLEVERSGLSAEIGKLRKEGVIESRRNRFKLLKQ